MTNQELLLTLTGALLGLIAGGLSFFDPEYPATLKSVTATCIVLFIVTVVLVVLSH